ncbi:type II secretion system protein N [Enterovibrio nigricans]|uniref:Type II secretion system protein N n=1 Tax=Enterovibrio nigricans DSM 22720 TaxID=1121868 RepID=A0A1T4UA72_9GAMM|nr:type II secretion system protein N [Enterovibrio nigricans]PKF51405.1 type II secretion system protein N [Enterovibrio nigricans]SKA49569.1 general secretion pathway protein N [Enterovibrio nigricans DSM 22720]
MKRIIIMSMLFVLTLLVSLVVHIPANFIFSYIPPVQGLQLGAISGTIWSGTAASVSWQGQPMGKLNWHLNIMPLLTGNADVAIRLSGVKGLSAKGNIGYGMSGAYANNLLFSTSANVVQSFIPYPLPVSLAGQFDLTVRDYLFTQKPFCDELEGNIAWSQGSVTSQLGTIDPGLVVANLTCDEGRLSLDGGSKSDALETEFSLLLSPDQRYNMNGWFVPGNALPPSMKGALGFMGQPDNEGRYRLSFSG